MVLGQILRERSLDSSAQSFLKSEAPLRMSNHYTLPVLFWGATHSNPNLLALERRIILDTLRRGVVQRSNLYDFRGAAVLRSPNSNDDVPLAGKNATRGNTCVAGP